MMLDLLKRTYSILSREDRLLLFKLLLLIIIVAIIEVAGVASIMPFMAVVGNPEVVEKNIYLFAVYKFIGSTSVNNFLVFLGIMVFGIILLNNVLKALALRLELKFVHFRLYNISRRLLYGYLSQPYEFFLNHNSSTLSKNILQEVSQFSHSVLSPCAKILSRIFTIVFILVFLFFVDPILAILIFSVLGGAYLLLYTLVQKKLESLGKDRFLANTLRSKVVNEAFSGIKELKVLNGEKYFYDLFSKHAHTMETKLVVSGLFGQLPTYIMESLCFGGILLIVIYFLLIKQSLDQTLPIMALYAFAGYRLMPSLQGIFSAATLLRFNLSVVDSLYDDLVNVADSKVFKNYVDCDRLPFNREIGLESVTFRYNEADSPIVQNLNLTIPINTSVGIVGTTGSGKTTIVDIILGLLTPQQGTLMLDGNPIDNENMARWQRNIGYVPQSIFVSDDTLTNNIALGVPSEKIDMVAVERASRIANLHDFVIKELSSGYDTIVGDRGVRLSGGQRQRIGIARALYHDPNVLIMDEATSALDNITEEAVIQAIRNLAGKKTIIAIAHRLTTLISCDLIYVMNKGQIVESGTFEELAKNSEIFKSMLKNVTE